MELAGRTNAYGVSEKQTLLICLPYITNNDGKQVKYNDSLAIVTHHQHIDLGASGIRSCNRHVNLPVSVDAQLRDYRTYQVANLAGERSTSCPGSINVGRRQ